MASFRCVLVFLVAVACARISECRSTNSDTGEVDYYDDEPQNLAYTREDGVQADENDNVQADDGSDGGDNDDDDDSVAVKQTIRSQPIIMHASAGSTVLLPCEITNVTANSNEFVTWRHNNELTIFSGVKTMWDQISPDVRAHYFIHKNWSLEIFSVNASDAGAYTCGLLSGKAQNVTHTLLVNRKEAPAIVRMTANGATEGVVTVTEGSTLNITCETRGMPRPTLIWSKTDAESKPNHRISTEDGVTFERDSIIIDRVERRHEGEYTCFAENGFGTPAVTVISVRVLGKPSVHVHKTSVNGAPGVTVVLECSVHYEPRSTVTWFKDGTELTSSPDLEIIDQYPHSTVKIMRLKEKDLGTYTCVAQNIYGEHRKSAKIVEEPVVEPLQVVGGEIVWHVQSHLPLHSVFVEYRRIDSEDKEWKRAEVKPQRTEEKHVHLARYSLADVPAGRYEARAGAKNDAGGSTSAHSLFFDGVKDEPNPESIKAAGVGIRPSSSNADLKSVSLATILFFLIVTIV